MDSQDCPVDDLLDLDLPQAELERLARVDALLRAVAAHDAALLAQYSSCRRSQ